MRYIILLTLVLLVLVSNSQNTRYLNQEPPGLTPKVFAPGLVSTEGNFEFAGTFSPDCREFYFTRRENGTFDNRLYHVVFDDEEPVGTELAPFAKDCFEYEPHISRDGKYLFYGSKRAFEANGELAKGTNIWVCQRDKNTWGKPEFWGSPFDKAMFVCMAEDGTMYNSGLSKSERVDGKYSDWEKIADHLKGPYGHPCVGPNESYIIFDSDYSLGGKGKALLISFKMDDGSWSKVISFRELEIFKDWELFGIPMLSPDYKYLFFNHKGDIYWVDARIIEQLKTKIL